MPGLYETHALPKKQPEAIGYECDMPAWLGQVSLSPNVLKWHLQMAYLGIYCTFKNSTSYLHNKFSELGSRKSALTCFIIIMEVVCTNVVGPEKIMLPFYLYISPRGKIKTSQNKSSLCKS